MDEYGIVRGIKNVPGNIVSIVVVLIVVFIGTTIFRFVWFMTEKAYTSQEEIKEYGEWNRKITPDYLKTETGEDKVVQLKGKVEEFLIQFNNIESDEGKLKEDTEIFKDTTNDDLRYYNGIISSDNKVNVNCASYHIHGNQGKKFAGDDKKLFGYFAKFFSDNYSEMERGGQNVSKNKQEAKDYVPHLTRLIELENPKIIIRMLYILNCENKNQVIFPGTQLTAKSGYNATQRPWYEEYSEYRNQKEAFDKDFNKGDITEAYQDFVVKGIVRTYIKEIKFKNSEYIFCVDFFWKADYESEKPLANFFSDIFIKAISIWDSFFVTVLGFIFLLVIQGIFFKNKTHVSKFLLGKRKYYLNANKEGKLTIRGYIEQSRSTKIGTEIGLQTEVLRGIINMSHETKNGNSIVGDEMFIVNASENPNLRGIEHWKFYLENISGYKALGIPFNIFRKNYFCDLIVTYYPNSDLRFDFRGLPGQRVGWDRLEKVEENKIYKYIKRLVHIKNGRENLINESLDKPLPVPDLHNTISNRDLDESELFLNSYNPNEEAYSRPVLENRLPFKKGLSFLRDIYSNQEVNSVCQDRYLKALLEDNNVYNLELLRSGSKIKRIILYESSENLKHIIENYKEELGKLISFYTNMRGYNIYVSCAEGLSESLKDFTEKDFALVGENLVVVTDELYKENIVGNDEGVIKIEGYVSWRDVDVQFYRKLFDLIQQKKKYLWEVIKEYDKPK